ncbi:hypothetical protein BGZ61DRAFT_573342 [Ilyonectria robusta]|uniref:uncharacterized protein n=1 Tax=Ilyonectria robusta TaxID=1079257 RepID=UPI001E8E2700|nr:uncharacterized protein BGZ61DRAFT_573342 [Ilyonectria robusta]KAH8654224.1 hypothetical protein BGZ61DRAFT_573342 [Ilyonectria robusta]
MAAKGNNQINEGLSAAVSPCAAGGLIGHKSSRYIIQWGRGERGTGCGGRQGGPWILAMWNAMNWELGAARRGDSGVCGPLLLEDAMASVALSRTSVRTGFSRAKEPQGFTAPGLDALGSQTTRRGCSTNSSSRHTVRSTVNSVELGSCCGCKMDFNVQGSIAVLTSHG